MTASHTRSLPQELAFDHDRATDDIVAFLRRRLDAAGLETYVLGLSGGVDSACAAALAARAVGPERLVTVKMPARTSSPESRLDAEAVEAALGVPSEQRLLVEVGPMVDGWHRAVGDAEPSPLRRGNVAARSRMIVLWDLAARHRGIVLGTENRTEGLLGYFTIYGDRRQRRRADRRPVQDPGLVAVPTPRRARSGGREAADGRPLGGADRRG